MSYTKENWIFYKNSDNDLVITNAEDDMYIARIFGGLPDEEQNAKARLIAAAPDLLYELEQAQIIIEKLLDMVRDRRQTIIPDSRNTKRKAAIAKAFAAL